MLVLLRGPLFCIQDHDLAVIMGTTILAAQDHDPIDQIIPMCNVRSDRPQGSLGGWNSRNFYCRAFLSLPSCYLVIHPSDATHVQTALRLSR